jgi:hypothetical protein
MNKRCDVGELDLKSWLVTGYPNGSFCDFLNHCRKIQDIFKKVNSSQNLPSTVGFIYVKQIVA